MSVILFQSILITQTQSYYKPSYSILGSKQQTSSYCKLESQRWVSSYSKLNYKQQTSSCYNFKSLLSLANETDQHHYTVFMTNRYLYRFIILSLPTMADLELTREKADSSLYLTFLQSRAIHLQHFLAKLFMRSTLFCTRCAYTTISHLC